ncbi:MAG: Na/Pi cotransporter [Proteobacteria bacterium]|nr:MAG: Na/Pi cotransporter [Pseudomonadota bacterium]
MDTLLQIINLLGALGVFLFGMKIMSEGLQKVAGARLKQLIGRMTSNRVKGVLTGFATTTVVQSSSATTVMLVGFVNAGLLNLKQAIGVVMGANIGTTVTGWLVALLGFKVKIAAFALPAVGVGVALSYMSGARRRQLGEVLVGFGLLFLGLSLMKDSVPGVEEAQLAWVQDVVDLGFVSILLFVGIGTVLTVLLQSSSATMTLTLALTASGFIPYELAASMVLGENIGTTATANIAAIGATTAAKRAARAHLVFNLVGVIWALALFQWALLPVVDAIVPGDPTAGLSAGGEAVAVVTAHLAAFHTVFNLINTTVMLPFVGQIARFVSRITPEREPDEYRVSRYVSTALVETPELLLAQVGHELRHMTEIVRDMFTEAMRILQRPDADLGPAVAQALANEDRVDRLEREITDVLAMTARAATSASSARQIGAMVLNTHRLERVADHCESLVKLAVRNHGAGGDQLAPEALAEIADLAELVDRSLANLGSYLVGESDLNAAEEIERAIDRARGELRERYVAGMRQTDVGVIPGLRLLDVISHLEAIGDRAFGIIRRAEATASL